MPLAGANAPITLSGTLVVHTAETLSGITISQLTNPGAPIIYGGSPAIMDMRKGSTPMGAIETIMVDSCYSQIGKHFGLPTHAYMGLSDAKVLDMQAGFESGIGTLFASLSGINMVSGVGMLNFESCFSIEKLIIDNDICGMAKRLKEGIVKRDQPMAIDIIKSYLKKPELLSHATTLRWYHKEQYMPSMVVDRNIGSIRKKGKLTTTKERAIILRDELLEKPDPKPIHEEVRKKLWDIMRNDAEKNNVKLPLHN
jgi:trimethylamine--corrinoid protein Co-methyltransferase